MPSTAHEESTKESLPVAKGPGDFSTLVNRDASYPTLLQRASESPSLFTSLIQSGSARMGSSNALEMTHARILSDMSKLRMLREYPPMLGPNGLRSLSEMVAHTNASSSSSSASISSNATPAPVLPGASTSLIPSSSVEKRPPSRRGRPKKTDFDPSRKQSKYKGVSWDKTMNAWRCKINSVHVGYFDDEIEAARAYDEASITIRGKELNTDLNFPVTEYNFQGEKPYMIYKSKHDTGSRGTSVYRGVLWDKTARSWRAKIKHKSKTKYLGLHQCEIAAARAYDAAAIALRGRSAHLNFPNDHPDFIDGFNKSTEVLDVHIAPGNNDGKGADKKETRETLLKVAKEKDATIQWAKEDDDLFFREISRDRVLREAAIDCRTVRPVPGTSIEALLLRLARATRRTAEACGCRVAVLADDRISRGMEVAFIEGPKSSASAIASAAAKRQILCIKDKKKPEKVDREELISKTAYVSLLTRLAKKKETALLKKKSLEKQKKESDNFAEALTLLATAVRREDGGVGSTNKKAEEESETNADNKEKEGESSANQKEGESESSAGKDSEQEKKDQATMEVELVAKEDEDTKLLEQVAQHVNPSEIVEEIRRALLNDGEKNDEAKNAGNEDHKMVDSEKSGKENVRTEERASEEEATKGTSQSEAHVVEPVASKKRPLESSENDSTDENAQDEGRKPKKRIQMDVSHFDTGMISKLVQQEIMKAIPQILHAIRTTSTHETENENKQN